LDPIISCGLILINSPNLTSDTKNVKMMMVRRKDSMAYTEFLRGKYEVADVPYIQKLLSNMTTSEHSVLKSLTFDELWTKHWGIGRDHHSKEFEASKEKFVQLNIPELTKNIEGYSETEWGFPKGRRFNRESDMNCAIREFSEETNIPRESYSVCQNIILTETFAGTNDIMYKHIYYIALLRNPLIVDISQKLTLLQKREISAIEWKTISECKMITRPHYVQRPEMLNSFERILQTFDLQDNLASNQG
jgi:8-oxo-dGTP pyrophosphatase MutT (NUDIX family)